MGLPFHPLANLFPLIEGAEFDELCASIRANGLRDPIVVYDGLVLDGRNRQRACEAAEVDCVYAPLTADDDPLQFVIDKNLKRRHLDESQRAYVAAKLSNLDWGKQARRADETPIGVSQAAVMMNVSPRSVERARVVRDDAVPELQSAVEQGKIAVSAAASATKLSAETQRKVAAAAEGGNINAARAVIKQESRDTRECILGAAQAALPDKKYGVIYADPEWRFEVYSRDTGMDRAADNHYPTSVTDEICKRPVAEIAADDCVLFLWATVPMLPDALRVMAAWSFDYKSHEVWRKDRLGTGFWFRNVHELLLVGTRGNIPAPAMGTQFESVIDAPAGKHSVKPDVFYEIIESYFPTLPKIELNARRTRPNWDAWGLEAPMDAAGNPLPHDDETGEIAA